MGIFDDDDIYTVDKLKELFLIYCYDKSLIRGVAREMGIPVLSGVLIKSEDITSIFR